MPARALAAAAIAALSGCAHVEAPPGGPEDRTPPRLLTTRPDSLSLARGWRGPVVFVFDERLSERGIEQAVTVSPRTSSLRVSHRGDEIRVEPRDGWRPGIIYHVSVRSGIRDLFGNPRRETERFVFSTGPEIPDNAISGIVRDPITGRPRPEARVEAILQPDSLVYAAPADSAGRFVIARLPEGGYLVRAYDDLNRNLALDPYEPRDSLELTLGAQQRAESELRIIEPDSTAPRITSARLQGRTLELEFDDHLDPEHEPDVRVVDPDGGVVPISRIGVGRLGAERPAADTVAAEPPGDRLPAQRLRVEFREDVVLQEGVEYRVLVRGARNLSGLAGDDDTLVSPTTEGATGASGARRTARPGGGRAAPPLGNSFTSQTN